MTCADWRTGGESTLRAAAVSSCCTRHPAGTRGTRPCSHGPAGLRARRRKRPTGGPRGRRLCSLPFGAAYRWELLSGGLCPLRTYPPPSICPQRAYGGRVSPAPNAQASGRLHRPAAPRRRSGVPCRVVGGRHSNRPVPRMAGSAESSISSVRREIGAAHMSSSGRAPDPPTCTASSRGSSSSVPHS
jgi:hypothetical protein